MSAELDALADQPAGIDAALAAHSIYAVSEELLRWAGEQAGQRGLPMQIHLSELGVGDLTSDLYAASGSVVDTTVAPAGC